MTTLSEAREAASELKRLQQAANLLPQLEAQQAEDVSQAQLERLRDKSQGDIDALYPKYLEAYNTYREKFKAVIDALKVCSKSFQELEAIKKQIRQTVDRYIGSRVNHALKFTPNFDLYRDSVSVEMEAQNELSTGNLDLPVTPSDKGLGVFDMIFRTMIQFF